MNKISKVHGKDWDGILYPVNDRKDKIMIVLSGSEGGLEHAGKLAAFLAEHGIPALAFSLFKTKHTEKVLNRIPIDRIADVIEYLKDRGYKNIGIEGVSKGAEYALAAAIAFPSLSCVIVKTPSWFYSEGLKHKKPSGECCWELHGKMLPFTPYRERKFHILKMLWAAKEYNLLPINTGKEVQEQSIIPVEKIQAPILMFSTKVDTIWPSEESCEKLCARLSENNVTFPYKHINFQHMSHMMLENCGKEIRYFIKSEKDYPQECEAERKKMGQECIAWIENVWKCENRK